MAKVAVVESCSVGARAVVFQDKTPVGTAVVFADDKAGLAGPQLGDLYAGVIKRASNDGRAGYANVGNGQDVFVQATKSVPRLIEGARHILAIKREATAEKLPVGALDWEARAFLPVDHAQIQSEFSKNVPGKLSGPIPLIAGLFRGDPFKGLDRILVDDIGIERELTAAGLVKEIGNGLTVDQKAVEDADIAGVFLHALARTHGLPSGGRLTIDETAAGVAVDVDTARVFTQDRSPNVTNGEAVSALWSVIPMAGLGGRVTIDFLRPGNKTAEQKLKSSLGDLAASVGGRVDALLSDGLAILTIKRSQASIRERLTDQAAQYDPITVRPMKIEWAALELFLALKKQLHQSGTVKLTASLPPRLNALMNAHSQWIASLREQFGDRVEMEETRQGHQWQISERG